MNILNILHSNESKLDFNSTISNIMLSNAMLTHRHSNYGRKVLIYNYILIDFISHKSINDANRCVTAELLKHQFRCRQYVGTHNENNKSTLLSGKCEESAHFV